MYNALGAGLLPVTPFDLAVYLKRVRRGKRGAGKVRGHKRPVGRSMEERPAHVAPGGPFGHWEIDTDTVAGRRVGGGAAVLKLVEKRTRYLMVLPLAARNREAARSALLGLHEEYASRFSEVFASVTAVRTQLWIALCAYLLVAFLKFRSRLGQSILQILRLVQLNLFERRDLNELFCRMKQKIPVENNQLELFGGK